MAMNELKSGTMIPIVYCFDNYEVIPAAVSACSMLENAGKDYNYKLYALHDGITVQNQVKLSQVVWTFPNASIEFIDMDDRFSEIWEKFKIEDIYLKKALYKRMVPFIFPQFEKIILADADVVFLGDISKAYELYQDYREIFEIGSAKEQKISSGYLVENFMQICQDDAEEKILQFLEQNFSRLQQDGQGDTDFCRGLKGVRYSPLSSRICFYRHEGYKATKAWQDQMSVKAEMWFCYLSRCGLYGDYIRRERALRENASEFFPNIGVENKREGKDSPVMVSVLCGTYNHELFIRETLEGLVNQKTDFSYEIIVADDASTDSTKRIIEEYHKKYSDLIVPLLREENTGIGYNYYDALRHVRGRYLAICDGDDCWIDNLKLKKQVDFLEHNPEYNLCCSSYIKQYTETGEEELFNPEEYIKGGIGIKEYYTFKDLLYCRFIASCTVMIRWKLQDAVPEFLKDYEVIDFPLELIHAAGGAIKVMADEVFSRYHVHNGGITSKKKDALERETFRLINEVNEFLGYRMSWAVEIYFEDYKKYVEWERVKEEKKNLGNEGAEDAGKKQAGLDRGDVFIRLYNKYVPEFMKQIYRAAKRFIR